MVIYNETNLTAANNIYEVVFAINGLSDGYLGVFMLVSMFLFFLIIFKKTEDDTLNVFLADCVLTSLLGILLWSIGLINWLFVLFPIIGIFVCLVMLRFN